MTEFSQVEWKEVFYRLAKGDEAAFETIYNHFYPKMFAVAFNYAQHRQLAEDAVQLILLRIWEKREELATIDHPVTWMHTAAKYEIWEALRKAASHSERNRQFAESLQEKQDSPEDTLVREQQLQLIHRVINMLPPRQLQVYRLGREQGMTYAQIAAELKVSRETVKELMAKALKHIRASLEKAKDHLLVILCAMFFS